jgi:hypothetical protein
MLNGIKKVRTLVNKVLSRLYFFSLHDNLVLLISRVLNRSFYDYYSNENEVLRSKHSKPTLLIDRILRYLKIINNHYDLKINCKDKVFLEIGAGPLLGWGPTSIALDSEEYHIIEPNHKKDIFKSKKIKEKYFLNHYNHLKNVFNITVSFDNFYKNILKRIKIYSDINDLRKINEKKFDYIVSNSVIEHISDVKGFLTGLSQYDSMHTKHIHSIDFSNHSSGIYDYSKSRFDLKRSHKDLNLLRPSEVLDYFENIFKREFIFLKYLSDNKNLSLTIHEDWEKYNHDDLITLTGFIISKNYND